MVFCRLPISLIFSVMMSFFEGEWRKFCPYHIKSVAPSMNKIIGVDTNLITWLKSPFLTVYLFFISLLCCDGQGSN